MTDEPIRVVFRLDRNPLLVSVLGSAVHFQALQAGLDSKTCSEVARSSEDVCRETLSQRNTGDGALEVTLDTFADRIEIAIQCPGQDMPAVGLESFALAEARRGEASGINGLELLSRVDRVLYNTEDGMARTTLVKLLQPKR